MDDEWKSLQAAALAALSPLWSDFAKEGREGAALAPLGRYPAAAAWLAKSMGMSDDCITRKLGAMLAGWIFEPQHASILSAMLDRERKLFRVDYLRPTLSLRTSCLQPRDGRHRNIQRSETLG